MITLFIDMLGMGLVIPILPNLVQSMLGGAVTEASFVYGLLVSIYAVNSPQAPVVLPGAPFFLGSVLCLAALFLAGRQASRVSGYAASPSGTKLEPALGG